MHDATQEEAFPVSPAQLDHLRAVERDPSFRWTVSGRVRIEGELSPGALRETLATLTERNELLRTVFRKLPGTGEWVQVIRDAGELDVELLDLREADEGELLKRLDEVTSKLESPFDLAGESPLRVALARTGENEHVLLLAMPAAAADARGLANLATELFETLAGAGDEEAMQFADVAQFLREAGEGDAADAGRALWSRLDGDKPFEQRLALQSRATTTGTYENVTRFVEGDPEAFAREKGVSARSLYLAAWQSLLLRQADAERVVTGVWSSGRAYEGLDAALGAFGRFLPIATDRDEDRTPAALCHDLDGRIELAEDLHETFGLQALGVETPAPWPFAFEYRDVPEKRTTGALAWHLERVNARSEAALVRLVVETGTKGTTLRLVFDTAHLRTEVANLLNEQNETLLENAVARPDAPITAVSALPASQETTLRERFARTSGSEVREGGVHEWITEAARRTPDAVAVTAAGRELTYGELDEWSEGIARLLVARGLEPGTFVGLYVERSVDMIAGILGTLKAGLAYLPLPPDYPDERLRTMARDAGISCLLTRKEDAGSLPDLAPTVLHTDGELPTDGEGSRACTPGSPAYAIYTSGSTGEPKGVAISHANLAHSTQARFETYSEEVGAYLLLSSFAFDSSVAGIFWTLSQGGTLVLPPAGFEQDIPALAETIATHGVTHLLGLPSLWNALLEASGPARLARLASLKTVIVAGESALPEWVRNHREALPDVALFNEYGPTEATVWATVFDCSTPHDRPQVPIGRPIPRAEVFVVRPNGELAPIGVPGELFVGGAGVTGGYHERPEITKEKFVPHAFGGEGSLYRTGDRARFLPDGNLEFLGRIDQQVKIRGYRVELEEIEACLVTHPGVAEAAVVAVRQDGDAQLAAYVVAGDGYEERVLRAHLGERLPAYMVPASFVPTEALPTLPNGKVDRRALATAELLPSEETEQAEVFEAPEGPIEGVLAHLWCDLLKRRTVSRQDDFFALGGHSILATQLYARILETLGVKISLRSLFEERRLAAIATAVRDQADDPAALERRAEIALQVLSMSDDEVPKAQGA